MCRRIRLGNESGGILPWQTKSILYIGGFPFNRLCCAIFCHVLRTVNFCKTQSNEQKIRKSRQIEGACSSQKAVKIRGVTTAVLADYSLSNSSFEVMK